MRLWLPLHAFTLLLCGACAGTPQTDPVNNRGALPSLDAGLIGRTEPGRATLTSVEIVGQPNSSQVPGAVVRVIDLDRTDPPVDTTVRPDGSFQLVVDAEEGDVLRFVLVDGSSRSMPLDLVVGLDGLEPWVAALECWRTDPEVTVELDANRISLAIINDCDQPISVARAGLRAAHPAFAVTTAPTEVPSGSEAQVTVDYTPTGAASEEEVLLLEIDAPAADRRAITLVGGPEESQP